MNKRIIEWGKNALIVLLLICTVFLLKETEYYSTAFDYISGVFISTRDSIQASDKSEDSDGSGAYVYPMALSVSIGSGNRYASTYDEATVQADFQRFSAILAEALGSSGEPVKISRESWKNALERESVYVLMPAAQPLAAISRILGSDMAGSAGRMQSKELCLSCETGSVRLYYIGSDGNFYYCDTGVSDETLLARVAEFVPNNARFSHEISSLSSLRDSMLVPDHMPEILSVSAGGVPSAARIKELIFSEFEVNEYSVSEYTENDGTTVILDGERSFRLLSDGCVSYSPEQAGVSPGGGGLQEALELCWSIVSGTIALEGGDAAVYVSSVESPEEGFYEIKFGYAVNGIVVSMGEDVYAARFSFENGMLSHAFLRFKSYTLGQDALALLPVMQAAAIASESGEGGIELVYSESAEGINCVWVPK